MDALIYRVLAVYRLTYLILHEDGPAELAVYIRTWGQSPKRPAWVREGMGCAFCVSFWVAFAVILMPRWMVEALGVSALIVIYRKVEQVYWRELRLL